MVLPSIFLFTYCFLLPKTKANNAKNILFAKYSKIRKGLLHYKMDCKNILFHVPDKMAANNKLSPQYFGVTVVCDCKITVFIRIYFGREARFALAFIDVEIFTYFPLGLAVAWRNYLMLEIEAALYYYM